MAKTEISNADLIWAFLTRVMNIVGIKLFSEWNRV